MQVATSDNKPVQIRIILDTGTKPNWISQRFLVDEIHKKFTKLTGEENTQFVDFNGNKFSAIGKVDVMLHCTDFRGFPSRNVSFLVTQSGAFKVILGKKTIKEESLLCRPVDPERDEAFPAVQSKVKKCKASPQYPSS